MKQLILTFISALLLTACSMVGDGPQVCPDPGATENITLSFRMISSDIGNTRSNLFTRNDNNGHEEVDSDWPLFEDRINVNNFAFYIFLGHEENSPLVMKMADIAGSSDPNNMITGSNGAYTVTTIIPKANLEELLGRELEPGSTSAVDFRIVLLANVADKNDYMSIAPNDALVENGNPTTFAEFMENADKLQLNLNMIHNRNEGDSQISGIYKGEIPMFGMATFSTTEEMLYKSRPEERIHIGDIYMLRSVAKLIVIDNSEKRDGYPYISSVTVESRTNVINQLPAGAKTYANGYQVHAINAAPRSTDNVNTNLNNNIFSLGYLNDANTAVRFGYLPEQQIEYGLPTIVIRAQLDANRDETYEIPMTGTTDYPVNFGTSIIRNHIYTLSVNKIAVGTPAEITVTVDDWTQSSLILDYTESVIIPNKLTWEPSTLDSPVGANGVVIVKPWASTSAWSPIVGTFGIQSPVGARWDAYLITLDGDDNAFAFLERNESGVDEMKPSIHGIIDGKTLTTLRIVTEDPDPLQVNRARLQIVVTIGEGASATVLDADVTPENTSYRYYTIVQNTL